ncbi:MAG: dTDP-4-dehydrorhamnose 3,5-epimerase [Bacteroidia bacterium]|nr:dTDP-4-dehydrorhamnose 3,5-epimerase [Bacteroidia bacterium]
MNILITEIPDLLIIEPKVFEDERGYFIESYNENKFREAGLNFKFVQDNESKSGYGVVRGLHYQLEPFSQAKLIRVLIGKIYDVVVDLRENSPAFGKWLGFEISAKNRRQILIPRGFAHGFSVLSETTVFLYKCDNFYNPKADRGINYADSKLGIDWKIDPINMIISAKDKVHPSFEKAEKNFIYTRI